MTIAYFLDPRGRPDHGTDPRYMRLQRPIREGIETQILLPGGSLPPERAVQKISAIDLSEFDAELLGVTPGVAGLRIERISYLSSGRVVEFIRSVYRGDANDFVAEIRLDPGGG
jgi:GntR family transcriptional regulator